MTVKELWLVSAWTNDYEFCEFQLEDNKPLFPSLTTITSNELTKLVRVDDPLANREVLWFDIMFGKMVICLRKGEEK